MPHIHYLTQAAQEVALIIPFVQMMRQELRKVKPTHETAQLLRGRAVI